MRCTMRNSQVAEDVLANSLEDRLIHKAPQRDMAVLWLTRGRRNNHMS